MSEKSGSQTVWAAKWSARILGIVMVLAALPLVWMGAELILAGGSLYFALAGTAVSISGILIFRRLALGAWLYLATFIATAIWALLDAGWSFWAMIPRLVAPTVLAIPVLVIMPALTQARHSATRRLAWAMAGALTFGLCVFLASMFLPWQVITGQAEEEDASAIAGASTSQPGEWRAYGRTPTGTRFVPETQINRGNVERLQVAWKFHYGPNPLRPNREPAEELGTPIQVGNTLYFCTGENIVFALDAETGKQKWSFDPKIKPPMYSRCRGLGYHERTAAAPIVEAGSQASVCNRRLLETTIDGRLLALDAETGRPCADFGDKGSVDTRRDINDRGLESYMHTSAPTVVGNLVIIGAQIMDNVEVDNPSGVIRAFDVASGRLVWAWDMEHPERPGMPPSGESFSANTPNMWGTPTFDEGLGMIYVPTGVTTPDFGGGKRSPASEAHNAAVVALDIATGRERWTFRTVYHDLWDRDVAAQPLLYDLPTGDGKKRPVLIILSKRGQIFVLDRTTGKPFYGVKDRPVPTERALPDDFLSPVQPFSTEMPSIGTEPLTEASMWGMTPYDALWCRIQFRRMDYRGEFTPYKVGGETLVYPGLFGGFNWGGGSVDERHARLFVNDIRIPIRMRHIARAKFDTLQKNASGMRQAGHVGFAPQRGLKTGVEELMFQSPLGIPCNQPPWGTVSAIDLRTRKVIWQNPAGTIKDTYIGGVKTHMPISIGMPTIAGSTSTASGIVFFAGSQDYYLRAYDGATGAELWKGRLPVGAQGAPMSYVTKSGRQYVAVVAGGARSSPDRDGYVVAYALPK